jgi:hypothetical protein
MMRKKFNIILLFQSPSSPDFYALDRGVWMCSQAAAAKLASDKEARPEGAQRMCHKGLE